MGAVILRPHLAQDGSETAISFARRLGHFHTGHGGARRLPEDLGIDLRAFLAGAPAAVAVLAADADVDSNALASGMIRRLDRSLEFRGERWTRDFVLPEGARFCPDCLLEDGVEEAEWRGLGRIVWRLRPVLTCPCHGRALITALDADARDDLDRRFPGATDLRRYGDPDQGSRADAAGDGGHQSDRRIPECRGRLACQADRRAGGAGVRDDRGNIE